MKLLYGCLLALAVFVLLPCQPGTEVDAAFPKFAKLPKFPIAGLLSGITNIQEIFKRMPMELTINLGINIPLFSQSPLDKVLGFINTELLSQVNINFPTFPINGFAFSAGLAFSGPIISKFLSAITRGIVDIGVEKGTVLTHGNVEKEFDTTSLEPIWKQCGAECDGLPKFHLKLYIKISLNLPLGKFGILTKLLEAGNIAGKAKDFFGGLGKK
jgi:hypothetical protein